MAIYLSIKSLVYKELQPMAKAAGCQLLILDSKTYKSYNYELEKKIKVLGIDSDSYSELINAIEDWGCIAILKSKKYYGRPEIAQFFSKVGLTSDDVRHLNSIEAKKHSTWGDLDVTIPLNKRKFFYWFKVHVRNEENEIVMEKEQWKVDCIDNDEGEFSATFDSKSHAEKWITNRDVQERYEDTGFEVLKGPYCVNDDK